MKLSFCQNDPLMQQSFWQNNSLVTHIIFELQPIISPAQSHILVISLYIAYTICVDTHVPRVQSAHFPMRASPIRCCRYRRWLLHMMWTFEFFPSNRLIQKQGCLVERKKTSYQKTKEDRQEVPLWTIIENLNRKITNYFPVLKIDFQTIFIFNLKAFNRLFISSELWQSLRK